MQKLISSIIVNLWFLHVGVQKFDPFITLNNQFSNYLNQILNGFKMGWVFACGNLNSRFLVKCANEDYQTECNYLNNTGGFIEGYQVTLFTK